MSNSVSITFPTSTKSWLQRQSKRGGYGTVSDFIRDLVRKEQERNKIEKKLLSSLDSGPATPGPRTIGRSCRILLGRS